MADAHDAAVQMVTARLAGDRETAARIASEHAIDPLAGLALVLATVDLAALVHRWWANAVFDEVWGEGEIVEAWQQLALDLEELAGGG